ncbi:MAG: SDR family NAD(P)-dependent oxidoreductase [Acidobacteriota bacterium]|nr:SDR family NAD(P)-dependent oxidoreductase [Acidobacteriota bacterium]
MMEPDEHDVSAELPEEELPKIAVVGMAGRFPKSPDLDAFWQNLKDGVECISFFSEDELIEAGVTPMVRTSEAFVPARAVLDEAAHFDAHFFGMSPKEAANTDPQHRVFLECTWHALEHAGYDPARYDGLIGVYAGADVNTYALSNLVLGKEGLQTLIGNDKDYLATRVAYKLNLKGPAITIQTACSTSLVAVQTACQSLLSYQCDMALAGGVGIAFPQKAGYLYQEGGILSPDGHCRAFDAQAGGTVGGDGAGVVVLKRYEDAVADGDTIHALILGSAVNNDGSAKIGFTAPSVEGQAEVIAMAQAAADVAPETITYIETHGTATGLGDPIEFSALQDVFSAGTDKKQFCAIGSLKSNVGHMNSAAGIGSFLKTVLALKHKWLPPSLRYEKPNPMIDFDESPFYVQADSSPWEVDGIPRRAGVSSFGIGGTNAHVILEEAPEPEETEATVGYLPLMVSAATPEALDARVADLKSWCEQNPNTALVDVASTLVRGRPLLNHRRMVACNDLAEGLAALADPGRYLTGSGEAKNGVAAFMFPGQGAQYAGMGRGIYETAPVFREELDRCAAYLQPKLGLDLRDLFFPAEGMAGDVDARLKQTEITQPALFAFSYALAKQWTAWGVQPDAMIGHSVGEYVAACLAGVFCLEDALDLITERGRLIGALPGGAMLAVSLDGDACRRFPNLSIAVENGPNALVLGGTHEAVDQALAELRAEGLPATKLHTSHAFHTAMMDGALDAFAAAVSRVELKPPQIPYLSNVTGTWITEADACDPGYWVRHIRGRVRFGSGVTELLREPDRALLELGPGSTLCTLARKSPAWDSHRVAVTTVRHPRESKADEAVLLEALGQIALAHVPVEWDAFFPEPCRRIPLPAYPFQRERYWNDPHKALQTAFDQSDALTGKRPDVADWLYMPTWKRARPVQQGEPVEGPILFFREKSDFDEAFIEALRKDHRVITVASASSFSRDGDQFTIDPALPTDYQCLADEIHAEEHPAKIIHTGVLQRPVHPAYSFEELQQRGFSSLMSIARAFGAKQWDRPITLEMITDGAADVTGGEAFDPNKATVMGPFRVIPQEYHQLMTRQIDIVLQGDHREHKRLIGRTVQEISAPLTHARVALREDRRWVETFDEITDTELPQPDAVLREGGVYLITGGLGGIGLVLAEWMAESAKAKLILTGRKGLPQVDGWDQWLETHSDRDPVSFKINKIRHLESLGAEVMVISADVADRERMAEVIAAAKERFGEIHGAIHAAGVVDQAMLAPIHEATPEQAAVHFRPKIQGTNVLNEVLPDDLDFLVLFSSVATVLGGLGGAAYAAANAYLDARSQSAERRLTINWDAWYPSEESQLSKGDVPAWARFAILPKEGCEAFARILDSGLDRCLVSTANLQLRLDMLVRTDNREALERAGAQDAETRHARPIQAVEYTPPRDEVEEVLCEMWAALLGIDKVGIHDNFFKLGGDSLVAIQLSTRLRDTYGVDITVNHLFDEPTIAALADKVRACQAVGGADLDALGDKLDLIENMSEEEVARLLASMQDEGSDA